MRWLVGILIAVSFVSGGLVWLGQWEQSRVMETPPWLRPALVVHGTLFPMLCALFGYLVCQHIKAGLKHRANVLSGLVMEGCFLVLILTGAALYYASGERLREWTAITHRVLGLAFPVIMAWHWVAAIVLVRTGEMEADR